VRALKSAQKEVSPKALHYLLAQTGPPPPTLVNPASRVNVRYSVAMGWKADFQQAASVIVLRARQGASLRRGAAAQLFQLMGRDTAYWYRRGRGCSWAKAGSRLGLHA
jgi:hypothetical protein